MPAWFALQQVTAVDIAGALAANLAAELRRPATVSRLRAAATRR
jgi:hypothetical protein